jgi:excisionase family DNA binding protein
MTAPDWLTDDTTAEYLGVSKAALAKWRITGEGPKYARIGRGIRYRKDDLDDWMLSRRVQSTAEAPASQRRPRAGRKAAVA